MGRRMGGGGVEGEMQHCYSHSPIPMPLIVNKSEGTSVMPRNRHIRTAIGDFLYIYIFLFF